MRQMGEGEGCLPLPRPVLECRHLLLLVWGFRAMKSAR